MEHLGLRVAYDGRNFSGFQIQPHKNTVQAELEKAVSIVFRDKIRIHFTSRTDAGVHAYDQWVLIKNGHQKFLNLSEKDKKRLRIAINGVLPESIRVWDVLKLKKDFHPKHSVEWKEYHYKVLNGRILDPLMEDSVWWVIKPLDIDKIRGALIEFIGTHDFSSFAKQSGLKRENNTRTIIDATLVSKPHPTIKGVKLLTFCFRGNGFLHNMVRNMVGTLIKVGKGEQISIKKILKSKDRTLAGRNAPAQALILAKTSVIKGTYKSLHA